jgi:hypothetical protein
MHPLTVEAAEASYIRNAPEPTASDIQADIELAPLGSALIELLRLAQDTDLKAAKRESLHVMNGRRHLFQVTPDERVAEQLLNILGSPDDCWFLREIAERLVA